MFPVTALCLLTVGGLLEVAGTDFTGLDALVGLCFTAAMALGAIGALRVHLSAAGLLAVGVAAMALGLHLAIHLGLLS